MSKLSEQIAAARAVGREADLIVEELLLALEARIETLEAAAPPAPAPAAPSA